MHGKVSGVAERDDGPAKSFTLSEGEWFGEVAIRYNKRRTATITSATKCICLAISRDEFNLLLGDLEQMMARQIEEYQRPKQSGKDYRLSLLQRNLEDLECGPIVGRGKYGIVKFVRDPVR